MSINHSSPEKTARSRFLRITTRTLFPEYAFSNASLVTSSDISSRRISVGRHLAQSPARCLAVHAAGAAMLPAAVPGTCPQPSDSEEPTIREAPQQQDDDEQSLDTLPEGRATWTMYNVLDRQQDDDEQSLDTPPEGRVITRCCTAHFHLA